MTNPGSTPQNIISAENIALFSLLHDVPVQPLANEASKNLRLTTQKQTNRPACNLSFQTECRLADILAFLSSIKEDPNHIPAVCISENAGTNSLDVYIAVNKTSCNDGNALLQNIQNGFERIFSLLDNHSLSPGTQRKEYCRTVKKEIFSAVISMCSTRILQRLHLLRKGGGKKARKDLKTSLSKAVECVGRQKKNMNDSPLFLAKAKELIKLLDAWDKHQVQEQLEILVEGVYRLHKTGTVSNILGGLSNRDMDPDLRNSIVNMTEKVARYRQAARFLYRVATHGIIGRRLNAVPVNLPMKYFERPVPNKGYSPRLQSVLSRISPEYGKEKKLSQIRRLLTTPGKSADDGFSETTFKVLNKAKVHAEIQLLAYCEFQLPASCSRPRVICSCKDACYLCNLAIAACQGKMHTPRSHGKVYSSWQLPLQHRQLIATFNRNIESEIKESLATLLKRQQRTKYPCPVESRLGTLSPSITTLYSSSKVSPVASQALIGQRTPVCALKSEKNLEDTQKRPSESVAHLNPSQGNDSQQNDMMSDQKSQPSRKSIEDGPPSPEIAVKQTITAQHASPFYTNGSLEVQIELEPPDPNGSVAEQKHLSYSIGWLDETAQTLDWCHSGCIIDTVTLQGEVLHELCNQKSLCLRYENTVLTLKFY